MDKDWSMCAEIEGQTSVPATTMMLACDRAFRHLGVELPGLVTPYVGEIQERLVTNYAALRIRVVSEARLDD